MYFAKLNLDDPHFLRRAYIAPLAYAESKRAEVELTQFWSERLKGSRVVKGYQMPAAESRRSTKTPRWRIAVEPAGYSGRR